MNDESSAGFVSLNVVFVVVSSVSLVGDWVGVSGVSTVFSLLASALFTSTFGATATSAAAAVSALMIGVVVTTVVAPFVTTSRAVLIGATATFGALPTTAADMSVVLALN